jgi:hypothetical protein
MSSTLEDNTGQYNMYWPAADLLWVCRVEVHVVYNNATLLLLLLPPLLLPLLSQCQSPPCA